MGIWEILPVWPKIINLPSSRRTQIIQNCPFPDSWIGSRRQQILNPQCTFRRSFILGGVFPRLPCQFCILTWPCLNRKSLNADCRLMKIKQDSCEDFLWSTTSTLLIFFRWPTVQCASRKFRRDFELNFCWFATDCFWYICPGEGLWDWAKFDFYTGLYDFPLGSGQDQWQCAILIFHPVTYNT